MENLSSGQALFYSFIFCHLITDAGGFIIFSAISKVSSSEADDDTDDSVSTGWEKNDCSYTSLHHTDAIRSRMKAEWESHTAKQNKQKWKGPLSCSQHSYSGTCPFKEDDGRVLAVKGLASSTDMWRVWPLVWQWAFIVLLADQHQKPSSLAWASTCF